MGDWDVVSTTPAQGARPAGEWDVVSTVRRGAADAEARAIRTAIQLHRHRPPPRRSGPVRQFGQGLQDTIATGVGLIVNPREAGQRSSARWRRGQ